MQQQGNCDDLLFDDIISGDFTTRRMYTKRRTDQSSYVNLEDVCAWTAEELIGSIDEQLDAKVAYGMTYIFLNSTIVFGKIGEQFFKNKISDFSQEKFSLLIAEKMLDNYNNVKRKQAVIQGIKDILNNKDNVFANAVKAAILSLEYFAVKEYEMSDDVEDRFFNDTTISYEEVNALITDKECGKFNQEEVMQQLEHVYNYLLEHEEEIHLEFKEYFSNLTKEELIVYYMANGDIRDIQYILKQME